jgi:hypothetical protein
MSHDLIPTKDADFNVFQKKIYDYANTALVTIVPPAVLVEWGRIKYEWEEFYISTSSGDPKHSDIFAKNQARRELETMLRQAIKNIFNAHPEIVTPIVRSQLGLPIYTGERVKREIGTKTPVIEGKADGSSHRIRFFDPEDINHYGVIPAADGVEIYRKVGGEYSADVAEYEFLTIVRKSPYVHTYLPSEAGTKVYYVARWYNSKGEKGPWSNFITIVVGN